MLRVDTEHLKKKEDKLNTELSTRLQQDSAIELKNVTLSQDYDA